jgi:hypothetical protein
MEMIEKDGKQYMAFGLGAKEMLTDENGDYTGYRTVYSEEDRRLFSKFGRGR